MRISDWSSDVCSSDLPFADVKIGKIHHIAKAHPIKDIAKRAAQHETQRKDVAACLFPPHPNRNETSDDGGQANQHPSHGIGIGAEKAHRHAEVADEMKVEKGQQLYRLPRLQSERIYHRSEKRREGKEG